MAHLATLWKAIVLSFIINYLVITVAHAATLSSTRTDDPSSIWGSDDDDEEFMPSFHHVKKLLNEGKPFFVDKDPVSGQLDFNHKKSAGVVDDYKSPAEELIPLRTNEITPNIHDFLHLPVKYSSSKSVYPLVSSSYANTKYQGSNKDQDSSNHKEYTNIEIQKRPNFFTSNAIFPFEKSTTIRPSSAPNPEKQHVTTPPRFTPTVTTLRPPLFPRRPYVPFPNRGINKGQEYYAPTTTTQTRRESTTPEPSRPPPAIPSTANPPLIPTLPTTTTVKTTYSPTVPTTTRPTTTTIKYESSTEKVATSPVTVRTTSSQAVPPTTAFPTATTSKPLVFPTEPTSHQLGMMLNNFAQDTNNMSPISANASPFQKPSGFKPNKDVVSTTTTANPMNNLNDYVKFDIHPPNMVSFNHEPVASMNNIKISPDQNVATFVLGSKQSFGVETSKPELEHQPPKIVGQVFNEPISGGAVSIRFPSKEEENRFENLPVITGAYKNVHDMPNGHSAPFGFESPGKNQLAFPPPSSGNILTNGQDSKMVGTKIVFESSDQGNSNPFPLREVLPLKSNSNQRPVQNDNGQPPEPIRNRPPFPPKFFNEYPPGQAPPKNSPPNRPGLYDPNLPNILPQFRPSSKSSYGPPGPPYKDTGAYRPFMPNSNRRIFTPGGPPGQMKSPYPASAPSSAGPKPGPPMRNYQYQTNRFQSKMAPAPPSPPTKEQFEASRRVFKIPQTQPLYAQPPRVASDRVFNVRPSESMGINPLNIDHQSGNRFTQMDPLTMKNNFIDEDLYKRPPQQELLASGEPKLEPVVTLQMIQTKKGGHGAKLSTLHADIPNSNVGFAPPGNIINGTEKPVYVVYPAAPPPPAPASPAELPSGGAYQNTPFTVIHHEQQPILTTLQKHLSVPKSPNRTNFPYQLEQPDPNSASELDSKTRRKDSQFPVRDSQDIQYNIGELPVPPQIKAKILNKPSDSISAKLPIVTDRPIAIAYTPTTPRPAPAPTPIHQKPNNHYYPMANYASDAHQTSFNGDHLYEQEFQAPFHPSVTLDGISDSYSGWAILDRTTDRINELEQNNGVNAPQTEIDRKDKNKDDLIIGDYSNDVRDTMNNDGFQPALEGGFRPIVPPHLINGDYEGSLSLDDKMPVAEKQVLVQRITPASVMAKDSLVDISAESDLFDADPSANQKDDLEEMVNYEDEPEEQEEVVEETETNTEAVEPIKTITTPELFAANNGSSTTPTPPTTTTEKVMSFEDALSAIFGLNDEALEEGINSNQADDQKKTS